MVATVRGRPSSIWSSGWTKPAAADLLDVDVKLGEAPVRGDDDDAVTAAASGASGRGRGGAREKGLGFDGAREATG